MAYSVLICDDEKIICEGLKKLIHWNELGFEVVACCYNGLDTIKYLEEHHVDLLITDIQLPDILGLSVVEYLFERSVPTKVILISAYENFEYARQAMAYNIHDYVTKPIRFSELSGILKKTKKILDESTDIFQLSTEDKITELKPYLQNQLLNDLCTGILTEKEEILKRSRLFGVSFQPEQNACCKIYLHPQDFQYHLAAHWKYGIEALKNALVNIYRNDGDVYHLYPIFYDTTNLYIVCFFSAAPTEYEVHRKVLEQYFTEKSTVFSELMGIPTTFTIGCFYENIIEMAVSVHRKREPAEKDGHLSPHGYQTLTGLQELFITYLNANDAQIIDALLTQYMELTGSLDLTNQRYFSLELFSVINIRFRDNGIQLYSVLEKNRILYDLLLSNSTAALEHICSHGLSLLRMYLHENSKDNTASILNRAVSYIRENYNREISLQAAADYVYLSPSYFSQLFRSEMGITFSDFTIKTRMEAAMDMLKKGDIKIQDVSLLAGYQNSKYFSKLFKRYTGLTPSDYQHQICILGEKPVNTL